MLHFLEHLMISFWNRLQGGRQRVRTIALGITLGYLVLEERVTRRPVGLSTTRRTMHLAVLGKTGSGKSSLLKYLCLQDIEAGRGFVYFDLHGDATPFLLRAIAQKEARDGEDLSGRLIVVSPADPNTSVGLNPLEAAEPDFVRIAEFAEVLKQRWGLDHFGARTDELLRNSLYALAANGLTLLELGPLLTMPAFRAKCMERIPNAEIRQYFEVRYGLASDAMQATMREPILNKTSAFTADPRFRHIVGQTHSTLSMKEAMDQGLWIVMNLEKGKLGGHALTLGSLILTEITNALFTREKRSLFSVYLDEMQNFVARSSDIETMLSEARKFGVSVCSANQFLDQYPAEMRAAILAIGTHVYFQVSSADAATVAQTLDGGKPLAERLKNLPPRHFLLKSGADRWVEARVPTVQGAKTSYTDLLHRSQAIHTRPRALIEHEIATRHAALNQTTDEVLHAWD